MTRILHALIVGLFAQIGRSEIKPTISSNISSNATKKQEPIIVNSSTVSIKEESSLQPLLERGETSINLNISSRNNSDITKKQEIKVDSSSAKIKEEASSAVPLHQRRDTEMKLTSRINTSATKKQQEPIIVNSSTVNIKEESSLVTLLKRRETNMKLNISSRNNSNTTKKHDMKVDSTSAKIKEETSSVPLLQRRETKISPTISSNISFNTTKKQTIKVNKTKVHIIKQGTSSVPLYQRRDTKMKLTTRININATKKQQMKDKNIKAKSTKVKTSVPLQQRRETAEPIMNRAMGSSEASDPEGSGAPTKVDSCNYLGPNYPEENETREEVTECGCPSDTHYCFASYKSYAELDTNPTRPKPYDLNCVTKIPDSDGCEKTVEEYFQEKPSETICIYNKNETTKPAFCICATNKCNHQFGKFDPFFRYGCLKNFTLPSEPSKCMSLTTTTTTTTETTTTESEESNNPGRGVDKTPHGTDKDGGKESTNGDKNPSDNGKTTEATEDDNTSSGECRKIRALFLICVIVVEASFLLE